MKTFLHIGVWVAYALLMLISFLFPIVYVISGLRKANRESFLYNFFPDWLKWIIEDKYVFWK